MHYLTTLFSHKDELKTLGCEWDPSEKKWICSDEIYEAMKPRFDQMEKEAEVQELDTTLYKFFPINFNQRKRAIELGAKFDKSSKRFYIEKEKHVDFLKALYGFCL